MNSIGSECNDLKRRYENCFNHWFSEGFLRGNTKDPCRPLFEKYQQCVKKAVDQQKINLWEVESDILDNQVGGMAADESSSQSDFTESDEDLATDLKEKTLEEILELKDRVGLRTYKAAIGLEDVEGKKRRKKTFKRDNKNRPREISSKIPVKGVRNIFDVKKKIRADPRFESGFEEVQPRNKIKAEFRAKQKVRDYAFIDDIRQKEKKELEESLAAGKLAGEQRSNAKKLLQKIQSREVSKKQQRLKQSIDEKYTDFLRQAKSSGEDVKYMNKTDRKKAELIAKYNDLKKTGRLDKYLEKKRKKNASRDRKKIQPV